MGRKMGSRLQRIKEKQTDNTKPGHFRVIVIGYSPHTYVINPEEWSGVHIIGDYKSLSEAKAIVDTIDMPRVTSYVYNDLGRVVYLKNGS